MSPTTLAKIFFYFFALAVVLISETHGSCWRYGHSCWGGHGKRSGSRIVVPKVTEPVSPGNNPNDGPSVPYESVGQQSLMEDGNTSGEAIRRRRLTYARPHHGNDLLREEMQMMGKPPGGEQKDEDLPLDELFEYDVQQQNDPSFLPGTHGRREGNDPENSVGSDRTEAVYNNGESEEGLRRQADFSSRRASPKDKLVLYKLVRVLRKK